MFVSGGSIVVLLERSRFKSFLSTDASDERCFKRPEHEEKNDIHTTEELAGKKNRRNGKMKPEKRVKNRYIGRTKR